jgi:hypothetical protein
LNTAPLLAPLSQAPVSGAELFWGIRKRTAILLVRVRVSASMSTRVSTAIG